MFLDLFINVFVLVSFVLFGGYVFKDNPINRNSTYKMKIIFGFQGSLMALSLMLLSIKIPDSDIIVDLRNLVLIILFYIAGIIPVIITGISIILYRIVLQGFNDATLIAVINVFIAIIVFVIVDHFVAKRKTQLIINFIVLNTILLISLSTFIKNDTLYYLSTYLGISILGFGLLYFLLMYVESANDLYRKYKENATKDFLTGLNNTRQFDLLFNHTIKKIMEEHDYFSVLIIDIDHFKRVNDRYGHKNGDLILNQFSKILKSHNIDNTSISRIGGEEFCLLAVGYDKKTIKKYAEDLRRYIERYQFIIDGDKKIHLTVSIGISIYPDTIDNLDHILEKADIALYNAKFNGRNKVCVE